MPKRLKLRPFRRGEKQTLYTKLHDRKLPAWAMHRYQIIALVRAGLSVFQSSRQVGSSPKMAYLWVIRFNKSGFRDFEQSSNPTGRPSQTNPARIATIEADSPETSNGRRIALHQLVHDEAARLSDQASAFSRREC